MLWLQSQQCDPPISAVGGSHFCLFFSFAVQAYEVVNAFNVHCACVRILYPCHIRFLFARSLNIVHSNFCFIVDVSFGSSFVATTLINEAT